QVNNAGLSRTQSLRFAAYDLSLTPIQTATTFRSRTYDVGSDEFSPEDTLSLGLERIAGAGTGNDAQWMIVEAARWRAKFSVPTVNAGGTYDLPCLFWHIRKTVQALTLADYGAHLGYQLVSKPVAMTVNGATRVYALCEHSIGIRRGQDTVLADPLTGAHAGDQTMVLMEF